MIDKEIEKRQKEMVKPERVEYKEGMIPGLVDRIAKNYYAILSTLPKGPERDWVIRNLRVDQRAKVKQAQEELKKAFQLASMDVLDLTVKETEELERLTLLIKNHHNKIEYERYMGGIEDIFSQVLRRQHPFKEVIYKKDKPQKIKEQKIPKTPVTNVTQEKKVDLGPSKPEDKKKPFSKVESIKDFFGL